MICNKPSAVVRLTWLMVCRFFVTGSPEPGVAVSASALVTFPEVAVN